ncbi:MAG: Uma2 family endonuclease [Bacteroidales bacterium]|nr:Uma2 family endonuclease [Bacteroidales bacterium]
MTMTVFTETDAVEVPTLPAAALRSFAGFRQWAAASPHSPEKTPVGYYQGQVWIDMSKEQLFSHGHIKTEFAYVIVSHIRPQREGFYFCNGVLLSNAIAELSCNPDGVLVLARSVADGTVRWVESKREGFVEIEGTPDLVLEVVSDSSVKKDTITLREAYFRAGIPEYWIADARGAQPILRILSRGEASYTDVATDAEGWVHSAVLGKAFRLGTLTTAGVTTATVEVR